VDLGFQGAPFTWSNNQEGDNHIKERLDRFCATPSWITRFTNHHLLSYNSDHSPILLVFGSNHDFRKDSHARNKLKRFENIWLQDPDCFKIVKTTWEQDNEALKGKLQNVLSTVHKWGMTSYGNIPMEIKKHPGQNSEP
jgi:hypothetical protein